MVEEELEEVPKLGGEAAEESYTMGCVVGETGRRHSQPACTRSAWSWVGGAQGNFSHMVSACAWTPAGARSKFLRTPH